VQPRENLDFDLDSSRANGGGAGIWKQRQREREIPSCVQGGSCRRVSRITCVKASHGGSSLSCRLLEPVCLMEPGGVHVLRECTQFKLWTRVVLLTRDVCVYDWCVSPYACACRHAWLLAWILIRHFHSYSMLIARTLCFLLKLFHLVTLDARREFLKTLL
jgi:hypothetical protein